MDTIDNSKDTITSSEPTTAELKERFEARSIPLAVDFSNLIDVAEYGRRALAKHPEQTPDLASGLQIKEQGQLTVKLDKNKGLAVTQDGIGIVANTGKATFVDSAGVGVVANTAKGVVVDSHGVGINTAPAHGLKLESNALKLAVSASNPGVELAADGLKVKPNVAAGVKVESTGVGINTGYGIIAANNQINIKLANGSNINGGGGQGTDGTVNGNAGGLALTDKGLSVDAGKGMVIDRDGVSIKCTTESGLTVTEADGLKVKPNVAAGIKVDAEGVGVVVNAAKGMMVESAGVGINTAPAHGLKLDGNALKVAVSASAPGVEVAADGLKVKPNAAAGVKVDAAGVGVVVNAAKGMMVDPSGVGINTAPAHGLKLDGNALKVAVSTSAPGVEVAADGVKVKPNAAAGVKVDAAGVGVVVNTAKGMMVDAQGVGINTAPAHGLKLDGNALKVAVSASAPGVEVAADGLKVKPNAAAGVKVEEAGVGVVVNTAKGMMVDAQGVGINTAPAHGLKLEGNALKVAVSASAPGVEVAADGMKVKPNAAAGVKVDAAGVGVFANMTKGVVVDGNGIAINPGNGITCANNQVNIKLANGTKTSNGGGGQGVNGTTDGNAGGLSLSADGLAVDAGRGLQIDSMGVSVKPYANWGIGADEGGVWVIKNESAGIKIDQSGIGVNVGNGIIAANNKINIKLAKGDHTNGGNSFGANGTSSGCSGGLVLSDNGLSVNPGNGIWLDNEGVSIKCVPNTALTASEGQGGLKLNYDTTLKVNSSNQLGVADLYVTKTGNSTVSNGSLTFGSDGNGISFYGGSRIAKIVGKGMYWFKPAGNQLPKICDNDGSNESNIATEQYVQANKTNPAATNSGLELSSDGLKVKPKANGGLGVDNTGVGINTASAHGLKLESDTLKLAVSASNPGVEVVTDGLKVKPNIAAGIKVEDNGIGINTGNGLVAANNQINIKLAKGMSQTNGGGGQGADGTTTGWAGGLVLTDKGLSVDAGLGMMIDPAGVSIKCTAASGLTATEPDGLQVKPNATAGVKVDATGVGVVVNVAKGMMVDSSGVGINTAPAHGLKLDANQLKLALSASGSGLECATDGVRLKVVTAAGLSLNAQGLGINSGPSWGLKGEDSRLKLALSANSPGVELVADGLKVKPNVATGIKVDAAGIGIDSGNGIIAANNKINIKLAKGDYTNGGSSYGENGTSNGASGGLILSENGLSVNPGNGIWLDREGVSVKCGSGSALSASESGGLYINYDSTLRVNSSNQLGVVPLARRRVEVAVTKTASKAYFHLGSVAGSTLNAYARLHIFVKGFGKNQRFVLSFSCDGNACLNGGTYSLDVSNPYYQHEKDFLDDLVIFRRSNGEVLLTAESLRPTSNRINLCMDYSPLDISGFTVGSFNSITDYASMTEIGRIDSGHIGEISRG
ncbi:hypothetical protein [Aeromonas jandaei]|uniref:hypothetical protein n=1 Tax=Aeromonas jandaei TaxID=650 RepID=UPI003B9DD557